MQYKHLLALSLILSLVLSGCSLNSSQIKEAGQEAFSTAKKAYEENVAEEYKNAIGEITKAIEEGEEIFDIQTGQ